MARRRAYDASGRQAPPPQRGGGGAGGRPPALPAHPRPHAPPARRLFLERGYASTSLPSVAADAGVSLEYLHKTFGGKAGLVRALYDRSLLGSGDVPAQERSDAAQEQETDAHALMHRFGALAAEVTALVAPMYRLIREAAGGDATMAALWRQVEDERYERMLHNARRVRDRGFLGLEVTVEQAADLFWSVTGAELYERLVLQRGWSAEQYGRLVGRTFVAALVD